MTSRRYLLLSLQSIGLHDFAKNRRVLPIDDANEDDNEEAVTPLNDMRFELNCQICSTFFYPPVRCPDSSRFISC